MLWEIARDALFHHTVAVAVRFLQLFQKVESLADTFPSVFAATETICC